MQAWLALRMRPARKRSAPPTTFSSASQLRLNRPVAMVTSIMLPCSAIPWTAPQFSLRAHTSVITSVQPESKLNVVIVLELATDAYKYLAFRASPIPIAPRVYKVLMEGQPKADGT